eukprot:CAMPEP_0118913196 /NCGR_PEP_ID=MMETSP1166-20130328/14116_1 /TAXON_ID=1104430 /ORGANISM="Chrysoreinhardia sp, Strain CCMP3193" /LENGTH=49 /DNA_ID= /DNA_START= /DNA_END= /DNA_ORIENTATION=
MTSAGDEDYGSPRPAHQYPPQQSQQQQQQLPGSVYYDVASGQFLQAGPL